ncbi:MAG TPA: DUF4142 domain-containing protein [Phenylobacterium sp.]
MIRPILMCAAAAAALSLAACQKNDEANPGQSEPVNKAQDTVGAAVGATSAATLGQTTDGYVAGAAVGDMYEIAAGKLAQQKGSNAAVKDFGAMLVKDHTATSTEMKPLATAAGQTPPAEMDQRRKGMIDNLTAATGADFDRAFIDQQIAAHEEALTLHQGYGQDGGDAGLKAFAAKTAPKIQAHLEQARSLQGTAGQGAAAPAAK